MVATWCQNMWQLATDMKCALWPVALYFNFYIFLVSKNTNLLSCVMQLLTASGRLSHTTRVLAPAQQRTNCIAVARRLFPFSQNEMFLFSWSHKSFIFIFRATGNASAVHEIQFFSSSSLCTLCAHFVHFCGIFVTSLFVWFRCTTQNPYQGVSSYVCVFVTVGHCTLLSGHQLQCSVLFPVVRTHCTGTA